MIRTYQSKLELKRGRYGASKAKAFTVLSDGMWYPARQLCILTGIGYHSLGRTLSRWVNFDYVSRRPILLGGDWEYSLTAKGKKWLRLAALYLPNYRLFMAELKAWQANLASETINELMSMGFIPFVAMLDGMIHGIKKIVAKSR